MYYFRNSWSCTSYPFEKSAVYVVKKVLLLCPEKITKEKGSHKRKTELLRQHYYTSATFFYANLITLMGQEYDPNFINVGTGQSNRVQIFFKIDVLKNFVIFTGKNLCWSLFLIKLNALGLKLYKNQTLHRCFPVKIAKF